MCVCVYLYIPSYICMYVIIFMVRYFYIIKPIPSKVTNEKILSITTL